MNYEIGSCTEFLALVLINEVNSRVVTLALIACIVSRNA